MPKNVCESEAPHFYRTGSRVIALNPALKVGPNKIHVQTNTDSVECMPLTSLSWILYHKSLTGLTALTSLVNIANMLAAGHRTSDTRHVN